MSQARASFYAEANSLKSVLLEPYLQDINPISGAPNEAARLLRNGLAIIVFNHFEAYITNRARECIGEVARTSISYADLPERLREVVTINSVKGIANYLGLKKGLSLSDKLNLIEPAIRQLSSFDAATKTFSGFGFNHSGSNLYDDDITDFMSAIRLAGGWQLIGEAAQMLGGGRPSLKTDFATYSRIRHSAAHNASYNVPIGDLSQMLDGVLIIGMSFDILISFASKGYNSYSTMTLVDRYIGRKRFIVSKIIADVSGFFHEHRMVVEGMANIRQTKLLKKHRFLPEAVRAGLARRHTLLATVHDARGLPIGLVG